MYVLFFVWFCARHEASRGVAQVRFFSISRRARVNLCGRCAPSCLPVKYILYQRESVLAKNIRTPLDELVWGSTCSHIFDLYDHSLRSGHTALTTWATTGSVLSSICVAQSPTATALCTTAHQWTGARNHQLLAAPTHSHGRESSERCIASSTGTRSSEQRSRRGSECSE